MEPQPVEANPEPFEERPEVLSFVLDGIGWYFVPLLLAGIIGFVLALIIVRRGKGPMAGAALLLVVHLPLLIGLFAASQGMISFLLLWAWGPAKAEDLMRAIARALVTPTVSLLVMIPSYAVGAVGALIRALSADGEPASK